MSAALTAADLMPDTISITMFLCSKYLCTIKYCTAMFQSKGKSDVYLPKNFRNDFIKIECTQTYRSMQYIIESEPKAGFHLTLPQTFTSSSIQVLMQVCKKKNENLVDKKASYAVSLKLVTVSRKLLLRSAAYYVNRYRNFISEWSNAESGYIRIPITSPTSPFHFPTYPEVNS